MGRPLMPPLSLTQSKNALAMFGMSVKSVPGCLVAMAPSLIGSPVAFWPVPAPHLGPVVESVVVPGLLFELQAASASRSHEQSECEPSKYAVPTHIPSSLHRSDQRRAGAACVLLGAAPPAIRLRVAAVGHSAWPGDLAHLT